MAQNIIVQAKITLLQVGYFGFQVTEMIEWGEKSNKTKKIPGPKINQSKTSHAESPSLNGITRKDGVFRIPKKIPYLNQPTQKNICQSV